MELPSQLFWPWHSPDKIDTSHMGMDKSLLCSQHVERCNLFIIMLSAFSASINRLITFKRHEKMWCRYIVIVGGLASLLAEYFLHKFLNMYYLLSCCLSYDGAVCETKPIDFGHDLILGLATRGHLLKTEKVLTKGRIIAKFLSDVHLSSKDTY
jgi:hypothetical protein